MSKKIRTTFQKRGGFQVNERSKIEKTERKKRNGDLPMKQLSKWKFRAAAKKIISSHLSGRTAGAKKTEEGERKCHENEPGSR